MRGETRTGRRVRGHIEGPSVRGSEGLLAEAEKPRAAAPLETRVVAAEAPARAVAKQVRHEGLAINGNHIIWVDDPVKIALGLLVLGAEREQVLDADRAEVEAGAQTDRLLAGGVAANAEGNDLLLDRLVAQDIAAGAEYRGRVSRMCVGVLARRDELLDRSGRIDHEFELAALDSREIEIFNPSVWVGRLGLECAQGAFKRDPKHTRIVDPELSNLHIKIAGQLRDHLANKLHELIFIHLSHDVSPWRTLLRAFAPCKAYHALTGS